MPNNTAPTKQPITSTAPTGAGIQNRCNVLIVEANRKLSSTASTTGMKNGLASLSVYSTNKKKIPVTAMDRMLTRLTAFGSSPISAGCALVDSVGPSTDFEISDEFMARGLVG